MKLDGKSTAILRKMSKCHLFFMDLTMSKIGASPQEPQKFHEI